MKEKDKKVLLLFTERTSGNEKSEEGREREERWMGG
jgi:hypothetical protein